MHQHADINGSFIYPHAGAMRLTKINSPGNSSCIVPNNAVELL